MKTLYDNVEQQGVDFLGASSRGAEFRCFQAMFWNCRAKGFVCTQPPPASPPAGYNWAVGCSPLAATPEELDFIRKAAVPRGAPDAAEGTAQFGPGTWESFGKPVVPKSLYRPQLKDRLSTLHDAKLPPEGVRQAPPQLLASWDRSTAKGSRRRPNRFARTGVVISTVRRLSAMPPADGACRSLG